MNGKGGSPEGKGEPPFYIFPLQLRKQPIVFLRMGHHHEGF